MNGLMKRMMLVLVLAALLAAGTTIEAQDLIDSGESEPYHPGLVSFRLGVYYHNQGDFERALAEFTETVDGLPSWGTGYAARGDTYIALGLYEEAIADYSEAVAIFPDYVSAIYTRGRAYHAIGETALAEADYANAIEQMPDYAPAYWGLGDLLFEQGQTQAALEQYQLYLALTTDAPDADVVARVTQLEIVAMAEMG